MGTSIGLSKEVPPVNTLSRRFERLLRYRIFDCYYRAANLYELPAPLSSAHPFYELDDERYGQVLNNTKVYAHNPAVLRAIKTFVGAYNNLSELPIILVGVRVTSGQDSLAVELGPILDIKINVHHYCE